MNISPWNMIFLAFAAQGIFLGFLLATRKKQAKGNRHFLALFIIVFSIMLIFWVGFWNQYERTSPHFNFLYNPVPLLLGPALFFYVKGFHKKLTTYDLAHVLPFIAVLLYFMPFFLLPATSKAKILANNQLDTVLWNWSALKYVVNNLSIVSFTLYAVLIPAYLNRISTHLLEQSLRKWLRLLTYLYVAFTILLILNSLVIFLFEWPPRAEYVSALSIGMIIYCIGYWGFSNRKFVQTLEPTVSKKYQKSSIDAEEAPSLIQKIIDHLSAEKPYLRDNYKLADLAHAVQIPSHQISELLNSYHKTNFSALINRLRIEEAKKLLISEKYHNIKIDAIGYDVGFRSRTSFYQWFKKNTGISPAKYQSIHRANRHQD